MNFSLNNLDKSIDRLIINRLANAIDENYLKNELISKHKFILKHTDKKSKPYRAYEKVYHYYRLGNFHEINQTINSDYFFIDCMTSDLIEALVKDKKIKEITSSNKYINSKKKNIENKNPKTNITALDSGIEEPSFVSPPPPLKQYVIVDNTLKNEIFKGCKWYIKTHEIYRKLTGEIFANTIDDKKILKNKIKEEQALEKGLRPFAEYFNREIKKRKEKTQKGEFNVVKKTDFPDVELKQNNPTSQPPLHLKDIFTSESKYNHIVSLLVKQGYCQAKTYAWIDNKKGNKGILVGILKHLQTRGYYINNRRLTFKEISEIAQNTFRWPIGIDTIKRSNTSEFNLEFIPEASTIP